MWIPNRSSSTWQGKDGFIQSRLGIQVPSKAKIEPIGWEATSFTLEMESSPLKEVPAYFLRTVAAGPLSPTYCPLVDSTIERNLEQTQRNHTWTDCR
jgi:hypothetical protein